MWFIIFLEHFLLRIPEMLIYNLKTIVFVPG
jgi:hypothetical protein